MSTLDEIYPELFKVLPTALPEFDFFRTGKGYRSGNGLKLNGEEGNSKGAILVKEDSPGWISDFRDGGMPLWNYIKQRDGLTSKPEIWKRLAELSGVNLPEQHYSPETLERIHRAQRISDAWEVANEFLIECLSSEHNEHARTMRANVVREYLTKPIEAGGRGYSAGLFRLSGQQQDRDTPKMELGYIPAVVEVKYCLQDAGFAADEVSAVIDSINKAGPSVGRENVLTFPYRDHAGRIKGMVFRAIDKTNDRKYLYSEFERGKILFNLKAVAGDKDLVIVESPLDAMHAAALGIKNITALGGASLNRTQIDLAVRYGATQLTLMLDNDNKGVALGAGAKGTAAAIELLQRDYPNIWVYVGQYPDGIKDLDELLIKQGAAGFEYMKANALPSWSYQLDRIFARYDSALTGSEELTFKQTQSLLEEVVQTAARLSPIDRDLFIDNFQSIAAEQNFPVTSDSIGQTVRAIREQELKQKQSERLQSLLKDAKTAEESGDTNKALDLLTARSREIKSHNKADSFAGLSAVRGEQHLKDTIRNRPEPLDSGFTIGEVALKIPAGAVSIMAGGTSHGKSIMLANLALNLAQNYDKKTFHLFSYEVDEERYLVNLLNAYIGEEKLAMNNRESIEHHFRGKAKIQGGGKFKGTEFNLFSRDNEKVFDEGRAKFFKELIDAGRIKVHYTTYDSDTLIEAIRYLSKTEDVGAILVDYIQLIYTPVGKLRNPSRQEEVKDMCIGFKDLVIETGLPLIFAAQFNREVKNLAQMHATKLGEAGDLERIADLILGIWNNSRKWAGTPSADEKAIIGKRLNIEFATKKGEEDEEPDPNTWYVEALKWRGGKVEVWDVWDYLPNAGKVKSIAI